MHAHFLQQRRLVSLIDGAAIALVEVWAVQAVFLLGSP